ncbi:MAG: YitT family protein [Clostridia bacterium]|nr:YitT family protein [Clostridia bacterium]MBQ2434353.1 YitT family protein [Clostridia bacterium]MBQ5770747.1 YitT family protein [Clostridia bacterium]
MLRRVLKEYAVITVGTAIIASAVYFFMLPAHLTIGSASALAMVIGNFLPLPVSAITLFLNLFLLVIGFIMIGREFGAKTVYSSVVLPAVMRVYEVLFPNVGSVTSEPMLDMVCYILVVGTGLALLFSVNASSGGLDIVAKIMNKYLHIELGRAMGLSGMLVALSSALCFDKTTVALSVIGTYFGGMIVDQFIFGLNLKRRVCIVSEKHDEIIRYILHEIHSGATIYEGIGAYTGEKRMEIIAIVDKQEYRMLMEFMHKTDPKAFMTVYSVNDIRYQPKKY